MTLKNKTMQGGSFNTQSKLRNQHILGKWLCRQANARKLRGETMAPQNSIDASVLGRTVNITPTFEYSGPVPVDGVMVHLNGNVFMRQSAIAKLYPDDMNHSTTESQQKDNPWVKLTPDMHQRLGIQLRVKIPGGKKALTPNRPFRGTGADDYLNTLKMDMDNVCMYNICIRQYDNRSDHRLSAAASIVPDYKAYHDARSEWHGGQKNLGGLPFAFCDFEPNTKQHTERFALRTAFKVAHQTGAKVRYHMLNPAFIASMRYLRGGLEPGDGNAWIGIEAIPRDVTDMVGCPTVDPNAPPATASEHDDADDDNGEAQPMDTNDDEDNAADTPMDTGEDNDTQREDWSKTGDTKCWYAVMRRHPIAWAVEDMFEHQREGYGVHASEFRVAPAKGTCQPSAESPDRYYRERVLNGCVNVPDWAPFIYCFVLPDREVRSMLEHVYNTFQNRVDTRVFGQVGFVIGPYKRQQCHVYRDAGLGDGTKETVFDQATGDPVTTPLERCQISFTAAMRYMVWPEIPADDNVVLTPQLRVDFPSLRQWADDPLSHIKADNVAPPQKRRGNVA